MTVLMLPSSFESTGTLQYQLQSKITTGDLNVPITWPNYGNSDWELEAGREMLDQAFSDFFGDSITVFAHGDGARIANLWLNVYGQTRYDDETVDVRNTKFYLIGD